MDTERKLVNSERYVEEEEHLTFGAFRAIVAECAAAWGVEPDAIEVQTWGDYDDWGIVLRASRQETDAELAKRLDEEEREWRAFAAKADERAANVALAFEQSAAKMIDPEAGGLYIAAVRLIRGDETIWAKIPMPPSTIVNLANVSRDFIEWRIVSAFPGFGDWSVARLDQQSADSFPDPRHADHFVFVRPEDMKAEAA